MKKLISILLIVLLALSLFTGCKLDETDEPDTSPDSSGDPSIIDPDVDLTAPVAKVGDITITYAEYEPLLSMYLEYFATYGYDVTSDLETLYSFQDDVLNLLVSEELPHVKGAEMGVTNYTDEQRATLDEMYDTEITEMHAYFNEQAALEAESDPSIDVEARAMEMILEEAAYNLDDENATYEDYVEYIKKTVEGNYLTELLMEKLLVDLTVTDEEVSEYYNELFAAQHEEYETAPEYYGTDEDEYQLNGGDPILAVPEGYSRYMHIYTPFEAELPAEYSEYETQLAELKAEYGELAFEQAFFGGTEHNDRLNTIVAEYQEISDKRDELYDEYASTAMAEANAAYQRLQDGEDFATVMREVTKDASFLASEDMMTNGRVISKTINFSSEISATMQEYFNELSIGDYSAVFSDASGFHIIYYVGDIIPGAVALADVKDALHTAMYESKKDEEWGAIVDAWYTDGTVTYYEDNYRHLGVPTDAVG